MGCLSCEQRRQAIAAGAKSIARGDVKAAAASAAYVGRTLAQDARSGALRQAASNQLAQLRTTIIRRR